MVDLKLQYSKIKTRMNQVVISCLVSTSCIDRLEVKEFQLNLQQSHGVVHIIPCVKGADSLY